MPTGRHSFEQIILQLQKADVHLVQGISIPLMCKKAENSPADVLQVVS